MKTSKAWTKGIQNIQSDFRCFSSLFSKARVLDLFLIVLMFAYLVLSNVFPRPPVNYLYNGIFVVLVLLLLIKYCLQKKWCFSTFVLFWASFISISLIVNLIRGIHSLTPYVNCINAIIFYLLFSSFEEDEKRLALRVVHLSFLSLFVALLVVYGKQILSMKSFLSFYDEELFGNLDGLSNYLAFIVIFSFYYFSKGEWHQLLISGLVSICIALTSRRTAFLLVVLAFAVLIYSMLKHRSRAVKIVFCICLLVGLVALSFMPFMREMISRFLPFLDPTAKTDGSSEARIGMIVRGFYYGFTHPFYGYGFNQVPLYVLEPNHDCFGDLAYAYGGLVAIIYSFGLFYGAVSWIRQPSEYKYLRTVAGASFFFMFFLSALFITRAHCLIVGVLAGLGERRHYPNPLRFSVTDLLSVEYSV